MTPTGGRRCRQHNLALETVEDIQLHILEHLITMEEKMTQFNSQGQAELAAATNAITGALSVIADIGQALQDLKSQEAASALDFGPLDAKVAQLNAAVTAASVSAPVVSTAALQVSGNTGAPAAPDAAPAAPTPAPADAANGTDASTVTDQGGQHSALETAKPLYKHAGTGTVDPAVWPAADVVAADDGAQLYTFANDGNGGPTGANADWTVYTGDTKPAAAPTA